MQFMCVFGAVCCLYEYNIQTENTNYVTSMFLKNNHGLN